MFKKIIALSISIFMLLCFTSCTDNNDSTINYTDITEVKLTIGGRMDEGYSFILNKNQMKSKTTHFLKGQYYPSEKTWTDEEYNEFIDALKDCKIEKWTGDYHIEGAENFTWSLKLSSNEEIILSLEGVTYPRKMYWDKWVDLWVNFVDPQIEIYRNLHY